MDVKDIVASAREAITVKRVYGEPYVANDITVIPAATVVGGAGGGGGDGTDDSGKSGGGGFGVRARPAGVVVIRDGRVRWKPAVDVNRIAFGALAVAALALLVWGSVERSRSGF